MDRTKGKDAGEQSRVAASDAGIRQNRGRDSCGRNARTPAARNVDYFGAPLI